jgi:hypothetical protein
MEILKFEGSAPRGRAKTSSNKKSIRVAVAVGAVALVAVLSSTLAANITINTGSNVEFGQGIAGAAACDGALTLTPASGFLNTGGSGGLFYLSSITVSDSTTVTGANIAAGQGLGACAGKYIRLTPYDNASSTPLTIASSGGTGYGSYEIKLSTNSLGLSAQLTTPSGSTYGTISTTTGSFTLNIPTSAIYSGTSMVSGVATAGQLYKITVESHS